MMMAYLSLSSLSFILLGLRFILLGVICFAFLSLVCGGGHGELLEFGRLVLFLGFQEILSLVCSDTPLTQPPLCPTL